MSRSAFLQGGAGTSGPIEKVMTLSQSEFAKSIGAFAGEEAASVAQRGGPVTLSVGAGEVRISFTKIEGFSFGGLVEMPRARVVIEMSGLEPAEADDFMRRFDISFQRGGG